MELEKVVDNEESLWKQKSHRDWIKLGDRNTWYFYSQVNRRRRINHIKSLKLYDGIWSFDEDQIKKEVVGFFR